MFKFLTIFQQKCYNLYLSYVFAIHKGPIATGFKLLWCPRLSVVVFADVSFVQPQNKALYTFCFVCVVYVYARFLSKFPTFQFWAHKFKVP